MSLTYDSIAVNGDGRIGTDRAQGYFPERALLYARITNPDPLLRMPLDRPPLSANEIETIGRWIEEGMLAKTDLVDGSGLAASASDDTIPPTVTANLKADGVLVGFADPDSGTGSLTVTLDGTELTDSQLMPGDRLFFPATVSDGNHELIVEGRDQQSNPYGSETGNVTRIVRTVAASGTTPPPDECEELRLLVDQLRDRVAELEGIVAALQAKIDSAIEVLGN